MALYLAPTRYARHARPVHLCVFTIMPSSLTSTEFNRTVQPRPETITAPVYKDGDDREGLVDVFPRGAFAIDPSPLLFSSGSNCSSSISRRSSCGMWGALKGTSVATK